MNTNKWKRLGKGECRRKGERKRKEINDEERKREMERKV